MQPIITGHHLTITDALRSHIDEKFSRLSRYFDHIISAQIILTVEKHEQKAEAILHVAGGELVANAEHEDMYATIDLLIDKLSRQLKKHKEKQIERLQGADAH